MVLWGHRMIPLGICQCGCGRSTSIAKKSKTRDGYTRGVPVRYVRGHGSRKINLADLTAHGQRQNGCLVWMGAIGKSGYGVVSLGHGRWSSPHRLVVEQNLGRSLRSDEFVCHRCDNKPCFELSHLFVGTPGENVQDAIDKGFLSRGEDGRFVGARRQEWPDIDEAGRS